MKALKDNTAVGMALSGDEQVGRGSQGLGERPGASSPAVQMDRRTWASSLIIYKRGKGCGPLIPGSILSNNAEHMASIRSCR